MYSPAFESFLTSLSEASEVYLIFDCFSFFHQTKYRSKVKMFLDYCRSDSAAQGYIEESEPGKLEIASRVGLFRNTTAENSNLAKEESQQSDSNVHISIDMSSSSNCSLNFVVPAQFLGKRYREAVGENLSKILEAY